MDSCKKMVPFFTILSLFLSLYLPVSAQAVQVRKPQLKVMPRADLAVTMTCKGEKPVISLHRSGRKVTIINQGKANAANFVLCLSLVPLKSPLLGKKTPVLLPGKLRCLGKKKISFLAAGQSRVIDTGPLNIPDSFACGEYRLMAVADPDNKVLETDESNNTAICPYFLMARIDNLYDAQIGESYGGMLWSSMQLYGKHFGSSPGNRKLRVGPHTLDSFLPEEWTATSILAHTSRYWDSGVYQVYLVQGNRRVSNIKTYNLKCWIFDVLPIGGSAPGAQVTVTGRNFGSSQGSQKLKFGTTEAAIVSWASLEIKAVVPSLPPGTYKVRIEKSGQTICDFDYKIN